VLSLIFKNFTLLDDSEKRDILELRNQEYIRQSMIDDVVISLENHLAFLKSLETTKEKRYFAVFYKDELAGSVNFIKNGELFWGLYFKDELSPMVKSCGSYIFLEYLFKNHSKVIDSVVRKNNQKALSFNKSFGFEVFNEDDEFVYLRLKEELWQTKKNSKVLSGIKKYLDKIEFKFKE